MGEKNRVTVARVSKFIVFNLNGGIFIGERFFL
jgi:hypothetical protein